jgi:hypothetical protein
MFQAIVNYSKNVFVASGFEVKHDAADFEKDSTFFKTF